MIQRFRRFFHWKDSPEEVVDEIRAEESLAETEPNDGVSPSGS